MKATFDRMDIAYAYCLFARNFSYIGISSDEAQSFINKIDTRLTNWGVYGVHSLAMARKNTKIIYMNLVKKWEHVIKP